MLGPHDVLAMIATSMDPLRFKAAPRVATCVGHDCWKPEAKHVELEVGLNQQPCGRNLLWMGVQHDRYSRWTGRNVNWEA